MFRPFLISVRPFVVILTCIILYRLWFLCMTYTYCCVYSTRLLMMDRKSVRNMSKNKFEKLVHLFGFIIRIYHDALSSECQSGLLLCSLKIHNEEKHGQALKEAWQEDKGPQRFMMGNWMWNVLPSFTVCQSELISTIFLKIRLTSDRAGLRLSHSKTLQRSHRSGARTRLILFHILYKNIVILPLSALSVGRAPKFIFVLGSEMP